MTRYDRHRARIERLGGGRAYMALIAEAVREQLEESAPRPWRTVDLQAGFCGGDWQRVYNALRRLEERGLVRCFRTVDCAWWAAGDPVCTPHGKPARGLVRNPLGMAKMGGYSCESLECRLAMLTEPWPAHWIVGRPDLKETS